MIVLDPEREYQNCLYTGACFSDMNILEGDIQCYTYADKRVINYMVPMPFAHHISYQCKELVEIGYIEE